MLDPSEPMPWYYYVVITLFSLYVLASLMYMAKRTCLLRQLRQDRAPMNDSDHDQVDPESQLDSLEQMLERQRDNGKAKTMRLRKLMYSFVYEVYSEDTTIGKVPLIPESYNCNAGEDGVVENNDDGRVKRTTLVLVKEKKAERKSRSPTSKSRRGLNKCCSASGGSLINESTRTLSTTRTTLLSEGDEADEEESTTALSRRLDKEAGMEPECVICLEPYEYGQMICSAKIEACGHIFHADCIQQWVQENEECPLCRVKLIKDDETVKNQSSR